jgi:hypothetical protein
MLFSIYRDKNHCVVPDGGGMSFPKLLAVCIVLPFLACTDVPKPLLKDLQPYSYEFQGTSQDTLFTAALAVLKAQGYDIESSNKYDWTIKTWDLRLPLGDNDCNCATDAGIVYYNAGNTTTEVVLTLTVFAERIVIRTAVIRKFVTPDPGYGDRFYCVSKGTIENDIFQKIIVRLRGGF